MIVIDNIRKFNNILKWGRNPDHVVDLLFKDLDLDLLHLSKLYANTSLKVRNIIFHNCSITREEYLKESNIKVLKSLVISNCRFEKCNITIWGTPGHSDDGDNRKISVIDSTFCESCALTVHVTNALFYAQGSNFGTELIIGSSFSKAVLVNSKVRNLRILSSSKPITDDSLFISNFEVDVVKFGTKALFQGVNKNTNVVKNFLIHRKDAPNVFVELAEFKDSDLSGIVFSDTFTFVNSRFIGCNVEYLDISNFEKYSKFGFKNCLGIEYLITGDEQELETFDDGEVFVEVPNAYRRM